MKWGWPKQHCLRTCCNSNRQQSLGTTKLASLLLDSNPHHHPLLLLPTIGATGGTCRALELLCSQHLFPTLFLPLSRIPGPWTHQVSYWPSPFPPSPSPLSLFKPGPVIPATIHSAPCSLFDHIYLGKFKEEYLNQTAGMEVQGGFWKFMALELSFDRQ